MNPKTIIPAFIFILLRGCFSADAQVLEQDSLALVTFYNSTGGPNWKKNTNWLTGPVSTWYGVTVENGRVTELGKEGILAFNNLTGHLPTEIGHLTALRKLISGNNPDLSGAIPEEIGNLHELVNIGIGNCSLSGTIPRSIGNCISLKTLSLRENNLSGGIPDEIGSLDSLKHLILRDNQLSGSIPASLGNCKSLRRIELNNNLLSGSIPYELGNCTHLCVLKLNHNQLIGSIPIELTFFEDLYDFNISNNQFSGEIPDYLSNLFFQNPSIEINLSDNRFSGGVPESWGDLSYLIDGLNISYNNLTSLPNSDIWVITNFYVRGNYLTFEHLESHYQAYQQGAYYYFYYRPQGNMMQAIDTTLVPESNYFIYSGTQGEFTNYKWFKDGILIQESTEADTLYLDNIFYADTGTYKCIAENSLIYGLTLEREPVHIAIDTSINITSHPPNRVLSVYPNPASDRLTIDIPGIPEQYHITLFSLNGESVLQHTVKNQHTLTHELTIKGLAPGIYLLQLQTEKETFTAKFTKIRQDSNR